MYVFERQIARERNIPSTGSFLVYLPQADCSGCSQEPAAPLGLPQRLQGARFSGRHLLPSQMGPQGTELDVEQPNRVVLMGCQHCRRGLARCTRSSREGRVLVIPAQLSCSRCHQLCPGAAAVVEVVWAKARAAASLELVPELVANLEVAGRPYCAPSVPLALLTLSTLSVDSTRPRRAPWEGRPGTVQPFVPSTSTCSSWDSEYSLTQPCSCLLQDTFSHCSRLLCSPLLLLCFPPLLSH